MSNRRFIAQELLIRRSLLKTAEKAIVNLSDHILPDDEKVLLCRGLTFCPQPSKRDDVLKHRDTLLFNRCLRIQHWFKDSPTINNDPFCTPTGWTPPVGKSPTLDTYINVITNEILHYNTAPPSSKNITNKELLALKGLINNPNIIIKRADKGGAIVLLNKADYIDEGLRQLGDINFYRRINRDPTNITCTQIQKFLHFLKDRQLIPNEHISFLTPKNSRTPVFYLLPKIHKANNPGRPIVSACDSPTENLSSYVDSFIKPLAQTVNSYIKDTNQFLKKLEQLGKIPAKSYLVTIDVVALYTSIPHRDGILAVKEALEKRTEKQPLTWVLLRLLHLILTKTAFKFNDGYYKQISGTTMGTKCAPSYAIIFMSKLESEFLATRQLEPLVWWRYIDDIFMIWPYS